MLDPAKLLIDATVERVLAAWDRQYARQELDCRELLDGESRAALTEISRSNALYHDLHHTVMVTLVGQAILGAKRSSGEPVAPREWLHFVLALVLHDIGIVGGVCQADGEGVRATGIGGKTIAPPRGSTDAWLAPYHVDRAQLYVRERYSGNATVDSEILAANIERTRFPVPEGAEYQSTSDLPGLVRAADLIGQLGDPGRDRKLPALFYEFEEIGVNGELGFTNPCDIKADYPRFFRSEVAPYIEEALSYLRATREGRRWVSSLMSGLSATADA